MAVTWQNIMYNWSFNILKRGQLVANELTGVSRQEDINSVQGDWLHTVSKSVCTVKISKLIHFPKNNMNWRYVLTVDHQWNTQLIESCIHVAIITARQTGW